MPLPTGIVEGLAAVLGALLAAAAQAIRERRRIRTPPRVSLASLPSVATGPLRPRVLLIEDDRASARAAARLLAMEGYEVDVAHTADEARHLAALAPYRVVLGDLLLGGEGAEAGSALLAELRERQRLRIVVYSGCAPEMLAAVRRELAPDAVVEKPDTDEMLAAVRAAVGD